MRAMNRDIIVPDSYEPGTVDEAWRNYRELHPGTPQSDYDVFRSGWRRGFGQGALLDASTFVHSSDEHEGGTGG